MILSPRECEAVQEAASSYNIDGNPEELVDDALHAICLGRAADEAPYVIARAAGVEFIGEFVWFKDRRKLVRADQARTLIAQAKHDQTYEGPIPDDDGKAIEEANALVELATDAWNDQVRGAEVETILRMAASFETDNGDQPEAQAEPEAEKIPPEEHVQDARPDLTQTAAAAFRTDDLDELAKVEPWEDYAQEKVSDIIAGINAAVETYELEEMYELLRNIWAYESSHRNRKTILDALEDIHTQIVAAQREEGQTPYAPPNQVAKPSQEPSPAPAGEAAPSAEDEQEPESTAVAEGGEEDGTEIQAPRRVPSPDAAAEPGGEAAEALPQGPADEAQPVVEAGPERVAEPSTDEAYQQLIADVEEEIRRDRMHIPEPPSDAAPELPWDWTKISDKELQQLYSTFSVFGYYVDYRLSRESRIALSCKQAADELSRRLLMAANKYDERNKQITVTVLEAGIEADPNVKLWRHRQRRHEAFASAFRSERDGYYKLLENLSRHESMRQDEWQRSGGKSPGILRRAGGK